MVQECFSAAAGGKSFGIIHPIKISNGYKEFDECYDQTQDCCPPKEDKNEDKNKAAEKVTNTQTTENVAADLTSLLNVHQDKYPPTGKDENISISTPTQVGVNCGNHHASICAECPHGNDESWCNDDCVWSSDNGGECQSKQLYHDLVVLFVNVYVKKDTSISLQKVRTPPAHIHTHQEMDLKALPSLLRLHVEAYVVYV